MLHTFKPSHAYAATGIFAVLLGGTISAFWAKQPSTFAMWASAYLVLVAGVSQVFFALAINHLLPKGTKHWQWWAFGLFNLGNITVITSTALKYSDNTSHLLITIVGSVMLIMSLAILGRHIYSAKSSQLKTGALSLITLLLLCIPIGLVLAQLH